MSNLKKTAAAVLALSSSALFAGTMGPVCAPGNVTIPCEKTAWNVGAKALYLQPTNTGNILVGNQNDEGTVIQDINPNWGWGFMVEGSYHFNTGNDLNVNWYHMNRTTRGALNNFALNDNIDVNGTFSLEPKWDQVNIEMGQEVNFSDMKNIRLHGGVQFSRVNQTMFGADVFGDTFSNRTTFNGFGPRVGIDSNYGLGNGFGIYANAAGSLLIGTMKQSDMLNATGFPASNISASKTTMVPELEAKLGARYDYAMAQGDLTLDAGYMWVNYFDGTVAAVGGEYSNFALNGVYMGLKWVGNV